MARPQGSKNKSTIIIEELQQKVKTLEDAQNQYSQQISSFTEGFVLDTNNQDIIKREIGRAHV